MGGVYRDQSLPTQRCPTSTRGRRWLGSLIRVFVRNFNLLLRLLGLRSLVDPAACCLPAGPTAWWGDRFEAELSFSISDLCGKYTNPIRELTKVRMSGSIDDTETSDRMDRTE